ncbi:MAG: hypothetical protein K8S25_17760 [Alphaproteobacteria bacterium]|nr:hypothetical protein [Alphaproteobacteria bacterium]
MKSSARVIFAALLAATLPSLARAGTAAPEGTQIVVQFVATVKASSRSDVTQGTISHVLKGSCRMQAGIPQPYGLQGPTKEQDKAMNTSGQTDKDLKAEAAKCKGDQACMMRVIQKIQNIAAGAPASTFQVWHPQSCSGSFSADDASQTNDPGGEGGGGAYKANVTVKGLVQIPEGGEDGWLGVYIETDLAKNTTTYTFTHPEPVLLDRKTDRTGYAAGSKADKVGVNLLSGEFPNPWGPFKGPPQAGNASKTIPNGKLNVEWQINR